MIDFDLQPEIEGIDCTAAKEGVAIKNRFDPHTIDFGMRKHKSSTISPAMLLHKLSRKKCRHRNSRQVDLVKQKFVMLGREIKERKHTIRSVQL